MEAANGDPLRAQEIERGLNDLWFWRFIEYRKMQSDRDDKDSEKVNKKHGKP